MKTALLVVISIMATSGTALAGGDFSLTLHYPEYPHVERPATDPVHTGSIFRTLFCGKAEQVSAKPHKAKPVQN